MFTGIVQNQGKVAGISPYKGLVRAVFFLKQKEKKLKLGESIAVNGVCLTVVKLAGKKFEADIMSETLKATNLGSLRKGHCVNLERSLKYGDRFGGHIVTGHVDACGRIEKIVKNRGNVQWSITFPETLAGLIAPKGSVAIDGVSLTVQAVQKKTFQVALIPFTLRETALGLKKQGDTVNLEADLVARYLRAINEKLKTVPVKAKLKTALLKKQGF